MAKKRQGGRRRHVPQRTCIACRRVEAKRGLIRVVRTPLEGVQVDLTGKKAGRGAYLCADRACWERALKHSLLNRSLKTSLTTEEMAVLQAFSSSLPEESELVTAPSDEQMPVKQSGPEADAV